MGIDLMWAKFIHPLHCTYREALWDKFGTGRRDQPSQFERCVVCGHMRKKSGGRRTRNVAP